MNPWFQLGATLFVGLLTAGGALLGVRLNGRVADRATEQRETQARREEWSKRFHQVLAYALDDESPRKQAAGLELLRALAESELAGPDELLLMRALADRVLGPVLREVEPGEESA
ncbi:hypothetical protein [Saccharothrix variisporea]|uniref:Uncharacterized protein n=1 Tax=Saccharothrix variisporea TaxID=543527 RepID=A0A495X6C6_9PSEU|nr:hypothetical protein [Saccharothrix variisporea]RKT67048.1 hypothetical protein DFJ66_0216 [Saccharothrix variisporea]